MRTDTRSRVLVLVALAALAPAWAACGGGGGTTAGPGARPSGAASRVWVSTWAPTTEGPPAAASSIAVTPSGQTVWVAGAGPLLAYDDATGKERWSAAARTGDRQGVLALAPDATRVYLTGTTGGEGAGSDYVTTAYDADTGARLWRTTYDGPAHRADQAVAVVATDHTVVVTGTSAGVGTHGDLATVGYDPATGRQRWVARYDGPDHGDEMWFPSGAHALATDRSGGRTYVVAGSGTRGRGLDFVTVAYDTTDGHRAWAARWGGQDRRHDLATAVAVSPDATTVVTTGMSEARATRTDIATVAYDAATGARRWATRYDGPAGQNEGATAVAFSPSGDAVFVAGTSEGASQGHEDAVTLAYRPDTGARLWADRFDASGDKDDGAADLAVSPDGGTVVVTGRTVPAPMQDRFATVAYAAADGARLWSTTYAVPAGGTDGARAAEAHAVVVAPSGRTAYVTGGAGSGYATVAYRW